MAITTNPNEVPRSNARTAWELCLDVKRAIRLEPRRANMETYACVLGERRYWYSRRPPCGTVGCFAGWVCLASGFSALYADAQHAESILGYDLNYHTVGDMSEYEYSTSPHYVFNSGFGDDCAGTRPGTRAHARAVCRRITKFMKANEAALKARVLEPIDAI